MSKQSKSRKSMKGNAALPVLFLVITLGILVAGGYFVFTSISGNKNSPLSGLTSVASNLTGQSAIKLTEDDFKDISDPLIRKHFVKQYSTTRYTVESTSNGLGAGDSSKVTLDYRSDTDTRMQMVTVTEGKEFYNMISIADTTYLKDSTDGKWWVQKDTPEKAMDSELEDTMKEYSPSEMVKEAVQPNVTYTNLGEEACGSLTCHKYEEVSGDADSGKRTFWFDTKELLLRREESGYGEYTSVSTYSYENINVSAPSPTKPVPEGKTIYEMMAGGMMGSAGGAAGIMPSEDEIRRMMEESGDSTMPYDAYVPGEEGAEY